MRRIGLPVLLAAWTACAPPRPPPGAAGPGEAVREFSEAVRAGNVAVAWSLLSARTRREADEIAARAREAGRGNGPANGQQMLFTAAQPGPAAEVRVLSQSADSALVQATTGAGDDRTFQVVREDGRWRIDLPLRSGDAGPAR